jgi:hypothetical protein
MKKPRLRSKRLPEWERLLDAQIVFQSRFPEMVLVGGTAAALHAEEGMGSGLDSQPRNSRNNLCSSVMTQSLHHAPVNRWTLFFTFYSMIAVSISHLLYR